MRSKKRQFTDFGKNCYVGSPACSWVDNVKRICSCLNTCYDLFPRPFPRWVRINTAKVCNVLVATCRVRLRYTGNLTISHFTLPAFRDSYNPYNSKQAVRSIVPIWASPLVHHGNFSIKRLVCRARKTADRAALVDRRFGTHDGLSLSERHRAHPTQQSYLRL